MSIFAPDNSSERDKAVQEMRVYSRTKEIFER